MRAVYRVIRPELGMNTGALIDRDDERLTMVAVEVMALTGPVLDALERDGVIVRLPEPSASSHPARRESDREQRSGDRGARGHHLRLMA